MNWSEMSASWPDMRALLQTHWPRLGDVMLHEISGDRGELGRALERQYGCSAPNAEIAIRRFEEDARRPGAGNCGHAQ
jgi:hypothetical protein